MRAILFFILLAPCVMRAGVDGVVTANKLNVRVRPGTKYSKVARLEKGAKLDVIKYVDGWYQVTAPSEAAVWIAASYVENGVVKKEVHLRSGPSLAFSSYRLAEPGETVKVLDTSRQGWLRIEPPVDLKAWVSAEYVYVTPENAAKLVVKPVAKGGKSAASDKTKDNQPSSKTAGKAEAAKDEALPFIDSKGVPATEEGYLLPLRKDSKYVTHAIVKKINGENFPICYLHSSTHNLKLWKGRRVTVSGLQRWVKGWQRPIIEVIKISPTM